MFCRRNDNVRFLGEGYVKGLPYFENPQYCPVISIQKWIEISSRNNTMDEYGMPHGLIGFLKRNSGKKQLILRVENKILCPTFCIFHRGFSGMQAVNFRTFLVRTMTENHTHIPYVTCNFPLPNMEKNIILLFIPLGFVRAITALRSLSGKA